MKNVQNFANQRHVSPASGNLCCVQHPKGGKISTMDHCFVFFRPICVNGAYERNLFKNNSLSHVCGASPDCRPIPVRVSATSRGRVGLSCVGNGSVSETGPVWRVVYHSGAGVLFSSVVGRVSNLPSSSTCEVLGSISKAATSARVYPWSHSVLASRANDLG